MTLHILHLEDSDDDAELICDALSRGTAICELVRVATEKTFQEALRRGDWDLILSDYSLPGFDGISALKQAKEMHPEIPVLFVTGTLGEERAVEILKAGATDYILKTRLDRLAPAVTRAISESSNAKARTAGERKLRESLLEKDILLQEVHHRVNNNLQIICSLLSLQSDGLKDPLIASNFEESRKRVQSMAKVHEMLYASNDLTHIDFAEYIRSLTNEVSSSYGIDPARIQLTLALEPIWFKVDRAIPCGLIVNELLSNAFKYAFPNGGRGEVRVSLRQQQQYIELAVEDTGIGLKECHFQSERQSLGLSIVNVLSAQLGGAMEVISDHGSHFILKLLNPTVDGSSSNIPPRMNLERREEA